MGKYVQSILALERGEWKDKKDAWERNEKRFQAGEDVYDDLRQFKYEEENNSAYEDRKERAVWPEFTQLVVEKFTGLLFQNWPDVDLGALAEQDGGRRAEMLRANADGTGADARTLWGFWQDEMAAAMATKYRWILAEAPEAAPATLADEQNGQRPYFVSFSPVAVPYWRYERGELQCIRIEETETRLKVDAGSVTEEEAVVHYVMTREGFEGWGDAETTQMNGAPDFSAGGWWKFNDEGEVIERGGNRMEGDWSATDGRIPVARLYYERGRRDSKRTGISNLGRLELNFMDQFSSLMNHAWESGSGATAFTGVSKDQWQAIKDAGTLNAKWFPVPSDNDGGNVGVEVINGGEEPQAIVTALEWIMKLAMKIIARELTTSPDASGRSRQLQHLKGNSPRLANMAGNLEEAMTTAHRFLESRWTQTDSFSVSWPREFDLRTVTEQAAEVFELFELVDAQAPSLFADMLTRAAREEGLLPSREDEEDEGLEQEIAESLQLGMRREQAEVERVEEATAADREAREAANGAEERRQAIEDLASENGEG